MTFSIVARCPRTGQFAVCVSSSSPSVAARCAFARAKVGAVTTQNVTDPRLGPRALDLLEQNATAEQARDIIVNSAEFIEYRQLTIIDSSGSTAYWSGKKALGVSNTASGKNVVAAGNLLASSEVPRAIVEAFEASDPEEELGSRVLLSMQAGLKAGGEAGPVKSAGMIIVDKQSWPVADLRVDWDDAPLAKLEKLWHVWQPQMIDYTVRCLNPEAAPSYGVPGDS